MDKKLYEIIRDCGIVGAGGAGFPTHIKVNTNAEAVIVNCAECEPLLRVDQQLMDIYADKIIKALDIVVRDVGANKGIIGLKYKYKKAINSINDIISDYPNISIHKLENFYPAGDEQVLVYEVVNKVIPEGSIPISVGCIVLNVETLLNIYSAYFENSSVVEKYITITGEVKNIMTVKVPIGISIQEVLDLAGGVRIDDFVVINGGPMMGKLIDVGDKVTKTTKGLIVLPKNHSLINSLNKDMNQMLKEAKTSCMHCSLCTEVCPRNLLGHNIHPNKTIRIASYQSLCEDDLSLTSAYLCCECRLCEYACIMDLQPWRINSSIKKSLSKNKIKNDNNNKTQPHPYREYKKYPVNKLISKLGIKKYDVDAQLVELSKKFTTVCIKLSQHIGTPSKPIVNIGDSVIKGDLIGIIRENSLGANIHASISGNITEITDEYIKIQK